MELEDLVLKFNTIIKNVNREIDLTLKEMSPDIIKANQNALDRGELSTSKKMPRLRSEIYIEHKFSIGSKAAPLPDLKNTGSFRDKMVTQIQPNDISILSTDSKLKELTDKYSIDIFGIQDAELENLQNIFSEKFTKKIDEILQLD